MSTAAEIFRYLLQTALSLYLLAVLLRLLLQLARADFYNEISQFVVKITNPLLRPLRRMIPPIGRLDTAAIVLALAIQAASTLLMLALLGLSLSNPFIILIWGALGIVSLLVNFYFFAVLALIIISWIAPQSHHPAVILLHQLTAPVMEPMRRLLPPMGGIDFSPILVFVLINVIEILIRGLARGVGLPSGLVLGI